MAPSAEKIILCQLTLGSAEMAEQLFCSIPMRRNSRHDLVSVPDQARATPCKVPPRLHTTLFQMLRALRYIWRTSFSRTKLKREMMMKGGKVW